MSQVSQAVQTYQELIRLSERATLALTTYNDILAKSAPKPASQQQQIEGTLSSREFVERVKAQNAALYQLHADELERRSRSGW